MTADQKPDHRALELAQHLESFKSSSHTLEDGTPLHVAAARELRRLALLEQAVPEGWKLVPMEPTREMLVATQNVFDTDVFGTKSVWASDLYRAMLNSAPPLPKLKEQTSCGL